MKPYRVETVGKGLRVVAAPQTHLQRAHVALYLKVGSRYETEKTNGLSHFLEHMLYRGTPRLPNAHAVNHAFESVGGYLYASTHVDFGIFSVTGPPESLEEATALFAETLTNPTFADIAIERQIVCEEILEDEDDEGRQVDADNISRKLIFPKHPLGFTITGTEKHVRSFDEKILRAHHDRHYASANAVLAFGGDVDPERAFALAEKHFGRLARGEAIVAEAPTHSQKKPRLLVVENMSSQTELRVCFRAPSESAKERPAVDMLMRILDDGMSTRLYHRLCDDKGLCYDVSAEYDGYEDDGILDFAAGVQHARVSVVASEIFELVTDLAKNGPTDEELAKAKRRNAWETRASYDSLEEHAGFYAGGLLFERFETPEDRLAANTRVTARDVRDVAAFLARPERLNVVAVGVLSKNDRDTLERLVEGFRGV